MAAAVRTFERIEPLAPCISPDGHSLVDLMSFGSSIPEGVLCSWCGKRGSVVVFD